MQMNELFVAHLDTALLCLFFRLVSHREGKMNLLFYLLAVNLMNLNRIYDDILFIHQ